MLELFLISSVLGIIILILRELMIKFMDKTDRELLGYIFFIMFLCILISGLVCYEKHGLLY